ncbi:MAG TPA: hypothetical protein VNX28_05280 [Gemmataceae bacterium]|jgi:hypothetical protein|nr:hypothetical protein [Gemmataceae bacterium]
MADGMGNVACLEESTTDLLGRIRIILHNSEEPLTLAKIRAALPVPFRSLPLEDLAHVLERHVAANVLVKYPRHRSLRERYWDRPMRVHLEQLLRRALGQGPLTWTKIRKRLPVYAKRLAESVLEELLAKGKLFRHPPASCRMGPRYGLEPPDPRPYLQTEFAALMNRCEQIGLARPLVRAALLDLLRAEEWAPSGVTAHAQPRAVNYDYVPS